MNVAPGREEAVVDVTWEAREPPLEPLAVFALGATAARLAERTLERDDAELARLRGVAAPGLLLLLGAAADLPWADGVLYLGHDADAAGLLMPTVLRPSVPAPLVERALQLRHPDLAPPVAWIPSGGMLIPAGGARSLDRGVLIQWLRGGF